MPTEQATPVLRSLIEGMWADGWAHGEIAATVELTKDHLSMVMSRMRRDGWDLPYRYVAGRYEMYFPTRRRSITLDTIDSAYERDPVSGCWVWGAQVGGDGYGVVSLGSKKRTVAHRVMYERHVRPIPGGMVIDHLCRNRACVNPAHLEAVTRGENVRRGWVSRAAEALIDRPRAEVDEAFLRFRLRREHESA